MSVIDTHSLFRTLARENKNSKIEESMEPKKRANEDSKKQIMDKLKSAITILEEDGYGRIDSVAWRVADAGLILRELIDALGTQDVPGVHLPTGMGATLPEKR